MEKSSPTSTNTNPSPGAKPRLRRIFLILGLLILGLVLVLLYMNFAPQEREEGTLSLRMLEVYKLTRKPTDSLDNVFAKDDRLLYFNEGTLLLQDLGGRTLWRKNFSENVLLDKNLSTILVVEKQHGNIYLFNDEGTLRASNLGRGPISAATLLGDGSVLVFYADNRRVQLFENDLHPGGLVELEGATITSADYSLRNDMLSILALREERGSMSSVLQLYSLEGRFLRQTEIDDLVLGAFLWDNGITLVYRDGLENRNLRLEREGERLPLSRVVSARKQERSLFITAGSADPLEGIGQMEFLRYSLNSRSKEFSVKIRENYDNIYSRSGLVLAYYKNILDLYGSTGELLLSETFTFPIKKAILLDDENLAVFDGERLLIMKIQY